MNSNSKVIITILLSLLVSFIGLSALVKAIEALTIQKMLVEIIGFYISVVTLHLLNSLLKDFKREVK